MIGYDLDGVLASEPEDKVASAKWFATCEPLLLPTEPFIAITARRSTKANKQATYAWLHKHYADLCQGVAMMDFAGNVKDIMEYKASVVHYYKLTDYTDNNLNWLNGMKTLCEARLWHWRKGMDSPVLLER